MTSLIINFNKKKVIIIILLFIILSNYLLHTNIYRVTIISHNSKLVSLIQIKLIKIMSYILR